MVQMSDGSFVSSIGVCPCVWAQPSPRPSSSFLHRAQWVNMRERKNKLTQTAKELCIMAGRTQESLWWCWYPWHYRWTVQCSYGHEDTSSHWHKGPYLEGTNQETERAGNGDISWASTSIWGLIIKCSSRSSRVKLNEPVLTKFLTMTDFLSDKASQAALKRSGFLTVLSKWMRSKLDRPASDNLAMSVTYHASCARTFWTTLFWVTLEKNGSTVH